MAAGNGPPCPVDPSHGRLYSWDRGATRGREFYCPHSAHGGNGKFFSDKEAHGEYELKEGDVAILYETAARDVIAGKTSLDQAVANVAKQSKMATSQVREAITIMIETIREKDTDMADKKAAAKTAKKAAPAAAQRQRADHTDATEFIRVRDELGLTAKQSALATGEAGMGSSSTYIYILTHEGATTELFGKYEAALRSYAKKHAKEIAAEKKEADAKAAAKAAPKARAAKATTPKAATAPKAPAKAAPKADAKVESPKPAAAKPAAAKAATPKVVKPVAVVAKAKTPAKKAAVAAQA